jgi:glycosyltransferase involved in cell wall biosynthesis
VPYIVSPRGMLEKGLIEQKSPILKAGLIAFIEKQSLEHAAAIHVTSAREAAEAVAFGFHLPLVREIPNGVDLDIEPGTASDPISRIATGPPYVLFLGRLSWKKGLDRLLTAFTRVNGVQLVIAGNDEEGYRSTLERQAQDLGISGRITFTGAVHGADKWALLHGAQLLVLPSYSENFGNVVIEAMAAGRPVVVTPEVGLAPAVSAIGAGLVAEGDAVELGGAITFLVNDAERRLDMGARGKSAVINRFSWAAVAGQMESLYASVTAGRSVRS